MGSTIRCASEDWWYGFYLPQTSLRIFRKIEVGSFGPRKGCREDCLVVWRVVHAPQGKAQLTFGILPGDDGCYLSQGCQAWIQQSFSHVLSRMCCPEWVMGWPCSLLLAKSSQPRQVWVRGWFSPKAEETRCPLGSPFNLNIQDYLVQLAAYRRPVFQLPEWWHIWLAQLSSSADHQSPSPSPNLEIIPSFLVSFSPLPFALEIMRCHESAIHHCISSKWWLLISGIPQDQQEGPWQHRLLHLAALSSLRDRRSVCVNKNLSGDYSCGWT